MTYKHKSNSSGNGYRHNGNRAERQFCNQFNCTWMDFKTPRGKRAQLNDIDAIQESYRLEDGTVKPQICFSIKDELQSSKDWGSILVETQLIDTRTGDEMDGWWIDSKAHYIVYKITWKNKSHWLCIKREALQSYINSSVLRKVTTRPETEEYNRSKGRKYDRAVNTVIPLASIIKFLEETPDAGRVTQVRNTK